MGCDLYKVSTLGFDVARYMPLDTALILVKALMVEYYNDPEIEYSIKRERRERREDEHTMEEFMYGQDMGNPEDGSL